MSRIYVIKVAEKVRRVVHLEDKVTTRLEVLEVLPPGGMRAVLERELEKRGFEIDGDVARRTDEDGVIVEVDLDTAEVTVSLEGDRQLEAEDTASARSQSSRDKALEKKLSAQLNERLEEEVDRQRDAAQDELTRQLEGALADIQAELDQIGNRVTAEALKEKAASMGEITEVSEDEESGSMTIKVKV